LDDVLLSLIFIAVCPAVATSCNSSQLNSAVQYYTKQSKAIIFR